MVEDLVGIVAISTLLDCPPSSNLLDPFMNCAQEDLDLASFEMFVDSMDPPTYLSHGRNDWTTPHQQALGMAMTLDGAGVPFSSMIVEGSVHSVDSLGLSVEEMINFIDENVSE
jgi:acetyl esterase/lipase